MTFPSSFSASPSHSLPSNNSGQYQSTLTYSSQQQQTLSYRNANGETVSLQQNNNVSASYSVKLSASGASESYTYSQHQGTTTVSTQTSTVDTGNNIEPVAPPLLDGAKNILSFIGQRLEKELANGASEEEINSLIEQGLAGFKQGYGEALDILKGAGDLSDTVGSTVATLYEQVSAGFDALRAQYAPTLSESTKDAEVVTADTSAQPITANNTTQSSSTTRLLTMSSNQRNDSFEALSSGFQQPIKSLIDTIPSLEAKVTDDSSATVSPNKLLAAEVEYGRKDRFSFTLETVDGDSITIQALNTSIYVGNYDDNNESLVEGVSNTQDYSMNIEGELDEDEVAAINNLMQQVMTLADEFYNGDVNKAYEQAIAVGYDQNEIASYALSLKQVEQYSVASVYQSLSPEAMEKPSLSAVFDTIGSYAQNVLAALNSIENNQTFDFSQFLGNISSQIDQQITDSQTIPFGQTVSDIVNHSKNI